MRRKTMSGYVTMLCQNTTISCIYDAIELAGRRPVANFLLRNLITSEYCMHVYPVKTQHHACCLSSNLAYCR